MISAVDSSVLFDVFGADPTFGPTSAVVLRGALAAGRVIACDVVWAEVTAHFPSVEGARRAMATLGIEFSAMDQDAASAAGAAWRAYRARGGTRQRGVADFLIGAHARAQASRLVSRDRGFYRSYFRGLTLLDPSSTPD